MVTDVFFINITKDIFYNIFIQFFQKAENDANCEAIVAQFLL